MALEIELTPRKLERIVFIVIILFFMSTTVYYSYKYSQVAGGKDNITGGVVGVEETEEEEKAAVEEVKEETETEVEKKQTKEYGGKVDITIAPIRYEIKESATWRKAMVQTLSFIVYNDQDESLDMVVKIYHSNSKTSEEYNGNPRTTLKFDTIGAGEHRTKTFFDISGINLYDLDLAQTLKFVFEDTDGNEVMTLTKVLNIE